MQMTMSIVRPSIHPSNYSSSYILTPLFLPSSFPQVVVAMTRDGGKSLASKALRTPVALWLGKVSAALYLIHFPIKDYTVWAINGHTVKKPTWDCDPLAKGSVEKALCEDEWAAYNYDVALRLWAVPIVVVLSIIAAAALFYGFEEPLRRCMRKEKRSVGATTTASAKTTAMAATADDDSGEGGEKGSASVV